MSGINHTHTDDIIIDADEHFIIDPVTRSISNGTNKKVSLMQYDNKSERYSFDIDRFIDGHDLTNCNRVQIHFLNTGTNREKHPGLYLVDDVHVSESDGNIITFTWLISQDATLLNGTLKFLISFECVDGDEILYRWSTSPYESIQITAGMDNDDTIFETYSDALLTWQNSIENKYLPDLVNKLYVEREFATSEEVAEIFGIEEV